MATARSQTKTYRCVATGCGVVSLYDYWTVGYYDEGSGMLIGAANASDVISVPAGDCLAAEVTAGRSRGPCANVTQICDDDAGS